MLGDWSDQLPGNSKCRNETLLSELTIVVLTEWYNYFSTAEEVIKLSLANYIDSAATGTPSLLPAYSTLSSQ